MKNIIIIFVILSVTLGCQNLNLKGSLSGTERGMSNEFNISSSVSEWCRLKSRISKPYDYDNIKIPLYSEHSVEFLF